MTAGWTPGAGQYPLPPHNVQVVSAYEPGVLDLRWDEPSVLADNTVWTIVGVNIYRSDVSDRGPFHRINPYPLGGSFYRDQTSNEKVIKESVVWDSSWVHKGDAANSRRWSFRTKHPIVQNPSQAPFGSPTAGNAPTDVTLHINGEEVRVADVFGTTGEIVLINTPWLDPTTEKYIQPVLPVEGSEVLITYWTNRNHIRSGMDTKLFYRITTVAISQDEDSLSGLVETPLDQCQAVANVEVETLDYIWREAARRNNWILEQGGERVKVFVRKQSGVPCGCTLEERMVEYSQQPSNRCLTCYGTGFIGGYEGPYETIMAPDDGERRIAQTPTGRRMEHTYEVFMGASPLVTQRDFIVKQTNERYSIGAVRRPTNRGNILQQHFTVGYLDEGDIRYKVPVDAAGMPWPETRDTRSASPIAGTTYAPSELGADQATPMSTEKDTMPDEREQRGRTRVWENLNN